jgi:hypothetical protein
MILGFSLLMIVQRRFLEDVSSILQLVEQSEKKFLVQTIRTETCKPWG